MITAVLVRISTGQILNRNAQLDEGTLPPLGLDPDLRYLIPNIPYPEPDYDSRYFILVHNEPNQATIQANNFPAHPLYSVMGEFLITYTTEKRTNTDIFLSIDNAMKDANLTIMPQDKQLECISLSQAALIKKVNGMSITELEQQSIDDLTNKCVKLRHNYDWASELKYLVGQGVTPDIDTGWQREE